jgi:hypothetical protein
MPRSTAESTFSLRSFEYAFMIPASHLCSYSANRSRLRVMGAARAQLPAAGRQLDNLPLELTSFVGREREVAELEELLGDWRLLTLCGPGGSGKTRLALAVAQEVVEDFEDGAWWVDLASISDPKLAPYAVATALGVREMPDRSLAESLAEYLGLRRSLVILDNCEHLIDGSAALADALLRRCPYLKILATSREPLRVAGEVMDGTEPLPARPSKAAQRRATG